MSGLFFIPTCMFGETLKCVLNKKTRINKGFWGVILLVIGLVVKRNILYDLWLWSVWDGLSNAVLYDNIGA